MFELHGTGSWNAADSFHHVWACKLYFVGCQYGSFENEMKGSALAMAHPRHDLVVKCFIRKLPPGNRL